LKLDAYLRERADRVSAALDAWLPAANTPPQTLHGAMRHLVFPGGKRLRPVLACAGAEAVESSPERALPMAVAVELVHVYSLIHDDLPCMDDDDERRGRPTVHVVYGDAVAVLAGDALLASAFECLARAEGYPPEQVVGALGELAHAAGSLQLVGGQADDLAIADKLPALPDLAEIEAIHLRKTAALMTAAIVGGARLGDAKPDVLERLRRFGHRLGVAFQIADDLLDRDSQEPCSSLRVLGEDGARRRATRLIEAALAELEPLGNASEPLRELARFSIGRDR